MDGENLSTTMNFERKNKDPYEILRIGERANALEFKTIHIIVVSTHMEKKLDGTDRKMQSQTVVLLQKHQMDRLMPKLQEGILTRKLIMGVLAKGEAPDNPSFISPPIFYTNAGVKWPSSAPNHVDSPYYIDNIVEKWIIVNGKFWKLPKILSDKYPKTKTPHGWEV